MSFSRTLAIIGLGPRGSYAFERLIHQLHAHQCLDAIQIMLFEMSDETGNGQVYNLSQPDSNWINISERMLELDARKVITVHGHHIPGFPSYHTWAGIDMDTQATSEHDTYPPRAHVGKYLKERFQSLYSALKKLGIITMHQEKVEKIETENDGLYTIITSQKTHAHVDEILITIGHQPTEYDAQMADWKLFTKKKKHVTLFEDPYPVRHYTNHQFFDENATIGIRGFGLAMIDVARAIAERFGTFAMLDESTNQVEYTSSHDIHDLLIPFSLDGLPPSPKPLTPAIDDWFKPHSAQVDVFKRSIGNKEAQKNAKNAQFVIDAITPIAATIFDRLIEKTISLHEIEFHIGSWLKDAEYQCSLLIPRNQSPGTTMKALVDMATGERTASLDFCVGQVWRHCQPTMYDQLSYSDCKDEVIAEIIRLDERMKRYAYGPPVESIQQILALKEAGVLNLDFIADPNITCHDDGWRFSNGNSSITVNMMINSVLDSPKIRDVCSGLITHLLSDKKIQPINDDLGIMTTEEAMVISKNDNINTSVALLGRLAKGTLIGVDAILECFGKRADNWAEAAAKRHKAVMA